MARVSSFIVSAAALAALAGVVSADISYNPVVTLIGTGSATTSGTGYTTSILSYYHSVPNQIAPVGAAAYNNGSTGTRLVTSASATSEGTLTNNPALANAAAAGTIYSGTGYAYSAGYDAALGTASVNGTAANANRSVGRASLSGLSVTGATVLQTQTQASAYNNNNVRGATGSDSDTSPTLYSAGTGSTASTAGWRNFGTNTQLASTPTNVRTVELLGNSLFGTTGSGTTGIYLIDPVGNTATLFVGTAGHGSSPYEFALFDDASNSSTTQGFNTAYIADDSAGILKYVYNGSAWTFSYVLQESGVAYRGLAGQRDPVTGAFTLFASTAAGDRLVQVTDTGASSAFTTLATAPANEVFRGVALTIPAPGSVTLLGLGGLLAARRRR